MKITVKNIKQEYPKIKAKLPEPLSKEKFDNLVSKFLPNYDKSEVIKKMVDTFVLKLNEVVAKQEPKEKVHKNVNKSTSKAKKVAQNTKKVADKAKKPVTKKTTSKKSEPKRNSIEAINVEHFTEDVRLLRRFFNCIGKERQRRTILHIYRDFERRITERKANKNSKHAELVEQTNNKLAAILDSMAKQHLTHVKIDVDEAFKSKLDKATKEVAIRTSVNLLKRFIGIEGETRPDKAKVKRIHTAFKNALDSKKITNKDFYAKELSQAYKAMGDYLHENTDYIAIEPTTLSGFGLGKSKAPAKVSGGTPSKSKRKVKKTNTLNGAQDTIEPKVNDEPVVFNRFQVDISPKKEIVNEPVKEDSIQDKPEHENTLNGLFTPITENAPESNHDKIELPGDLGKFLGYVERYEYAILLRGEKGAGKTRMTYQMMNTFAKAGFTVGCFTLEIGKHSNLVKDMRNQYLSPAIASKVQIAEACPNGLADIKEAAKIFDVVVIDSWGKIPNTKQDDFDKLRKEFPNTMFIVIFQSTTNGTARGGSMPEYDAGVVIQVQEGGKAICEKNRYSGEDLTYLVFEKRLAQPEPAA